MLLTDIYRNNLDIIFNNENIYDILDNIIKKNIMHIYIYGKNGCGKKIIIKNILYKLFKTTNAYDNFTMIDQSITNIKALSNVKSNMKIFINEFCISIYPDGTNSDKCMLMAIIDEYVKKKNLNNNIKFRLIIINEANKLTNDVQSSLRRVIEDYADICRFILWSYKLSDIIEPIQSRMLCIRLENPDNIKMREIISSVCIKENFTLSDEKICKLISYTEGNITKALCCIDRINNNMSLEYDHDKLIDEIVVLILCNNIKNIYIKNKIGYNEFYENEIIKKIYKLLTTLISERYIINKILYNVLLNINDIKLINSILKDVVYFNYYLINGRRNIIGLDGIIISILKNLSKYNYKHETK